MSNLKRLIVLFLILNLSTMEAQQKIDLPDFGLSFTIPEGWTGGEQDDYIVLGHQSIPGLMVLSENSSADAKSLKQLAMQGLRDSGIDFQPKEEFNLISDSRVEGIYEGNFNGSQATAYAIGLINGYGKGMNIMVITETSVYSEQHQNEARKLANSVKFYQAKDSDATLQWKAKITGRQLKYMNTDSNSDSSGGFSSTSTTRIINLCTNGQFTYYFNSDSSYAVGDPVDGMSTGNQIGSGVLESTNENTGSYKIYSAGRTSYLELNFADDTVKEFELGTDREDFITLDGTRYFNVDLEGCD
ncbi:hypothetical protein J1N09_02180 [Aureitalea sp. L0-47]|uniref:hypothetical protein n=1 Tax=Aureitalea sp. L0-47 TaxID=2816962 RepID=UPI0022385452|nr:hypothetical protein [Aureitalea sp. L0-47]MCW5518630.1 hypothetical protein [Aureitalea sp. L0-47]